MNVLIVYAHPEPASLNGSLKDAAIQHLEKSGHTVQLSDLYAMQWKATLDADDRTEERGNAPFNPSIDSKHAYETGTQSVDIVREQEKLRWADAVIFQFPLWWFSMPAILKGWVERTYACGFAYGVGEHSDTHWGDRYGEGSMAGKRAMLIVTAGGWESHYGPRGVNGPIDDLLFPIHHGILYYPGFDVLPPLVIYRAGRMDSARFAQICGTLAQRLDNLWNTPPIPFRPQNKGNYAIPQCTLKPEIAPDRIGFSAHIDDQR
ncbi:MULTISPECIES: NAD(P)H-dependent oxidoreductase [unclassified Brenneria]|uniref:NAD(P)H-dependent oxidoreductase n=1 Tax=unclassified Brenneria TaxID=2634434 RepID=UPI0018F078AF|nr:NAD(P)H-dependent oxidoreductase [Brenneria sp. L3-3C-1]MBJ7223970.1 NAD(P)H-dependent oxidoreductase [Brenneria sp. L3-3C-1]MEE3645215.1 NAD(P)H-dependent oxidoreductase [Brenneria sp. L3_3C_1]